MGLDRRRAAEDVCELRGKTRVEACQMGVWLYYVK